MTGIVETEHDRLTKLAAAGAARFAYKAGCQESTGPESRKHQARCIVDRELVSQRFVAPIDGIHARYGGVSLHGVI